MESTSLGEGGAVGTYSAHIRSMVQGEGAVGRKEDLRALGTPAVGEMEEPSVETENKTPSAHMVGP